MTIVCGMMKMILHLLLVILVSGSAVLAVEDFGEETTTMPGFTEFNEVDDPDSQSSAETPVTPMKPNSILNDLAWKIVQFEWNLSSAIQRRLNGPVVKAIRMRVQEEPALARIIGFLEGGVLSGNFQKRK